MEKLSRTDKFAAKALLPLTVGVGALCVIVWRPFEKNAAAALQPTPIVIEDFPVVVPSAGILLPGTSEKKVAAPKPLAHAAKTPAPPCWADSPNAVCKMADLIQGAPTGAQVLSCTCP
jgi:hypothetical protein